VACLDASCNRPRNRADHAPVLHHPGANAEPSLAGHAQVILGDAIPGLDARSIQILVKAVLHANGQRQFP